jgi:hypothetical protein
MMYPDDDECGCCELGEYEGEDYESCTECGHSPEEHEE